MKRKNIIYIFLICLLFPCCFLFSACGSNPSEDSNPPEGPGNGTSVYTPVRKNLDLNNYQQYLTITPHITTASSGYSLVYKFSGSDYCSFEDVSITYELFDYNILLNDPKVHYEYYVDDYNISLNVDGNGSTIRMEVENYTWKIGVLSISGDVIINKNLNKSNSSISLNMSNYQQYISLSQEFIQNDGEVGMLYWEVEGVRNYAYINVVITYDYYDYDYYGNEIIYDEDNLGHLGPKPYTCKLNLSGNGSTMFLAEDEEYIKILSISGTIKPI